MYYVVDKIISSIKAIQPKLPNSISKQNTICVMTMKFLPLLPDRKGFLYSPCFYPSWFIREILFYLITCYLECK